MSESAGDVEEKENDKKRESLIKDLPNHQYSRKELLDIKENGASKSRPDVLEVAFDNDDGKWDPDRWYKAKFGVGSRESSPLTLSETKDRRRVIEIDRDGKRRPSIDPVERVKESERDGIVLSPQRSSFVTGCRVQQTVFSRQLSIPDRDREDSRGDRDRDRDRDRDPRDRDQRDRDRDRNDRDRERDRPLRKVGSGRIQIERETTSTRDISSLRGDRHDDRDRDRDGAWNRDRERDRYNERDREWERDRGDRDRDRERDRDRDRDRDFRDSSDWDRERDRRFERSDHFRRGNERDRDRDFSDRRDRDFRDRGNRDRGFERSGGRRRNFRDEEKEPEWFTGGPTSQTDTIELRGFEKEKENPRSAALKGDIDAKNEKRSRNSVEVERNSKGSAGSEDVAEADGIQSQCSSPEEDQDMERRPSPHSPTVPGDGPVSLGKADNTLFDFDAILKGNLPFEENVSRQGSRFTQFFNARPGSKTGSDPSSLEDMLVPQDLLEDGSSPREIMGRSPGPGMPMLPPGLSPSQLQQLQEQHHLHFLQQHQHHLRGQGLPPDPAIAAMMPPPHFDPAIAGMPPLPHHLDPAIAGMQHHMDPAIAGMPHSDPAIAGMHPLNHDPAIASMPHPDPAIAAMTPLPHFRPHPHSPMPPFRPPPQEQESGQSSNLTPAVTALFNTAAAAGGGNAASLSGKNNFNPQDAEAQLKAMLFGGVKDSTPSSGSSSPLPQNVGRRVKTVAELEADMHQAPAGPAPGPPLPPSLTPSPAHQAGDMTAFNKLLTMVKAASDANQTVTPADPIQSGPVMHAMLPGNGQFNHALMRNKEQQLQLLHQSLSHQGGPPPPLPPTATDPAVAAGLAHALPPSQHKPPMPAGQPPRGLVPAAMSTPLASPARELVQGNRTSGAPVFSLLQQQRLASSARLQMPPPPIPPSMPPIGLAPQNSSTMLHKAREASPLMFSQQPPLHLSAPSPIHPSQLPTSMPPPSGARSPLPQVPSPHEMSAHSQAIMLNALKKKQMQDQKLQQHARPPSPPKPQFPNVVKPPPPAQSVMPPQQPKWMKFQGTSLDTFTPTSVLRKMHSDKAAEKEKQAQNDNDLMGLDGPVDGNLDMMSDPAAGGPMGGRGPGGLDDLTDISFLDPVNPNLVPLHSQLDSSLRLGQTNVLPAGLSQPMSVEEKPGYLSQMLDKSKAAAEASQRSQGHGPRPIVKGPSSDLFPEEVEGLPPGAFPQPLQHAGPPPPAGGRPVTGAKRPMGSLPPGPVPSVVPSANPQPKAPVGLGGRAIVGSTSVQQQQGLEPRHPPPAAARHMPPAMDPHMMARLPQGAMLPGMALVGPPPPHMGLPLPPGSVGGPLPVIGPGPNSSAMQQQFARAHAGPGGHPHLLGMGLPPPAHPGPLSPHGAGGSGSLSQAALTATIQRVAGPHAAKMGMNGTGGKVDVNAGIQRWFSPDILMTQLPSMPPLPTHGSKVMTVDELERH